MIPDHAIVHAVTYRPGSPPTTTVRFRAFLGLNNKHSAVYSKEAEEITFTGDEARAIAKRWLVPVWPPK